MKKLMMVLVVMSSVNAFAAEIICAHGTSYLDNTEAVDLAVKNLNKKLKSTVVIVDVSAPTIAVSATQAPSLVSACVTVK